jgi:hypothetical protein
MSAQTASKEDRPAPLTAAVARPPWVVVSVVALPHYRLHVRFNDGLEGDVDMEREVHSPDAGVFAQLADPAVFAAVHIEPIFGAVT